MDLKQEDQINGGVCVGGGGKSSYLCRQSSTRWIPTSEQIRILRELYYANGVRSPNAEQIQKISARLREFGKIEGKNVFYWFQNHKARERQRKRLSVDVPSQKGPTGFGGSAGRPTTMPSSSSSCTRVDDFSASSFFVGTANNSGHASPAVAGFSPSGGGSFLSGGQMGGIVGYGSLLMERGNFRECYLDGSLFSGGSYMAGTISEPCGCFGQQESVETDGNEGDVETLQLFPLRGAEESEFRPDRKEASDSYPYFGDHGGNDRLSSLELTLGSFPNREGYMGRFGSVDAGFRFG